MMFLTLLSVYLLHRGRRSAAMVSYAGAVLSKLHPAFWFPLFLRRAGIKAATVGAVKVRRTQVGPEEPFPEPGGVVLDYCAAVRGILNDDQGGPLKPPGLRMAEALGEVRASLERNLAAKKGGRRKAASTAG